MDRVVRNILAVAGAVAGLIVSGSGSGAQERERPGHGFRVGEPFPAISLPTLEDGELRSIADFRGRKVILHVFASW